MKVGTVDTHCYYNSDSERYATEVEELGAETVDRHCYCRFGFGYRAGDPSILAALAMVAGGAGHIAVVRKGAVADG